MTGWLPLHRLRGNLTSQSQFQVALTAWRLLFLQKTGLVDAVEN
jgi:hypothetical protein